MYFYQSFIALDLIFALFLIEVLLKTTIQFIFFIFLSIMTSIFFGVGVFGSDIQLKVYFKLKSINQGFPL